jgi:hypothetical protein
LAFIDVAGDPVGVIANTFNLHTNRDAGIPDGIIFFFWVLLSFLLINFDATRTGEDANSMEILHVARFLPPRSQDSFHVRDHDFGFRRFVCLGSDGTQVFALAATQARHER